MDEASFAPPSTHLPSIRRICELPLSTLATFVHYLDTLYNPPVRGTRRVALRKRPALDGCDDLLADDFERAYTIRWLTALVSQSALLQDRLFSGESNPPCAQFDDAELDALIRAASALIAVCAGTAATGALTRRFSFYSPSFDADVEVELTDVSIAVDGDAPTVGTQTWGSACLLAEMLVGDPARFGFAEDRLRCGQPLRVLELGAGTGLVSLTLARYLSLQASRDAAAHGQCVSLVASDHNPAVLENLRRNIAANFSREAPLAAHALDWVHYAPSPKADRLCAPGPPFDAPFDVILAADVVYEPAHAQLVHDCASALLRKPAVAVAAADQPRFHLVLPLRPTHTFESRAVEEVFPLATPPGPADARVCSGKSDLRVLEKEVAVCEEGNERPCAEVEYVHYVIGWS